VLEADRVDGVAVAARKVLERASQERLREEFGKPAQMSEWFAPHGGEQV
jgi:hypothetical protein